MKTSFAITGVACMFAGSMWLGSPMASALPFRSCAEARAAGATPVYAGQPGYSTKLDRDGDGVACETDGGGGSAPAPASPSAPPATVSYALPACYTSASPVAAQPTEAVVAFLECQTLTLKQLSWTAWGPDGADGTGTEVLQSFQNQVRVRASNPQQAPVGQSCPAGFEYYSDLYVIYPKGQPPGRGRFDEGVEYTEYDGLPAAHYTGLTPDCAS